MEPSPITGSSIVSFLQNLYSLAKSQVTKTLIGSPFDGPILLLFQRIGFGLSF